MSRFNFFERAARLGHSIEDLKAGKEVSSVINVPNVDDLRTLLDDGCDFEQRAQRDLLLFGPMPVNPPTSTVIDNSDEAIMRRVHGFLYGNTELLESDREIIRKSFPVHVAASSLENFTYDKPTDIGTSLPIVIKNYATVTINNGACVNVYNSELQYTMDTLIRNGTPPAGFGDFNILGVNGTTGTTGPAGTNQGKATKGTNGTCSSCGIASTGGKTGDPGVPGGEGKPGGRGNDGLPSRAATITITKDIQSSSMIVIYTSSGAGGKGGTGGAGGKGGDGGDGGTGATCSATGSAGGNGGAGASGGVGGDGGPGGNGVDKQNDILVYVPTAVIGKVTQASSDAPGGAGGDGGTGGAKGVGGTGGAGGPYNSGGSKGDDGGKGGDGGVGARSNVSGKPAAIQIRPL